ncbi:MAG: V-type ATPase subunit [Trueperaceae bacterium]|nr:MAG: V-type ATPase subunit [Trueperaceae bacterium]
MLGPVFYASVQARVRARYSDLLSEKRWRELLAAETLEDLGQILRDTPYGQAFRVAPVEFERNLIAHWALELYTLTHSLHSGPRDLMRWYARKFELDNLKTVLRTLSYRQLPGRAEEVLLPLEPPTLAWSRLLEVASVQALIAELRDTPYAAPLTDALERYLQEGSPFYLEVSIDLGYFQHLVRLMNRLDGQDRRWAERLLGSWIDLQNLLWAYRYRVYARLSPEEIVNYTLHHAVRIDVDAVRRAATGSPLWREAERLGLELSSQLDERKALEELEMTGFREIVRRAHAAFDGLLFHVGSVLAYAFLLEAEVHDLITLIEGKRHDMTAEKLGPYFLGEDRYVRA